MMKTSVLLPLQTIVSWTGSQANVFEKQKVCEIASLIRDTERHGKARIVDASEGEEPEEMIKVSNPGVWKKSSDIYFALISAVLLLERAVLLVLNYT